MLVRKGMAGWEIPLTHRRIFLGEEAGEEGVISLPVGPKAVWFLRLG